MERKIYYLIFASLFLSFYILQAGVNNEIITRQKLHQIAEQQHYQDIIINNEVVQEGIRDCQKRYDVIKPIIDQYKRSITILDLGAREGYYSFRIANDFSDATCIMVEGNNEKEVLGDNLLEFCKLNSNLKNTVLLQTKISAQEIERLGGCEYFDVILALDFIDQKDDGWRETLDAILHLGNNVFIDVTVTGTEQNDVEKHLCDHGGKLILQTPCELNPGAENKLYWLECVKEGIGSKNFTMKPNDAFLKFFKIESTYEHKYLFKGSSTKGIQWKPGINLVTFASLNGTYPTKFDLKQAITNSIDEHLADLLPWNVIIQGSQIKLIDQKDPYWVVDIGKSLRFIFETIDQKTQKDVSDVFSKYSNVKFRKRTIPKTIKKFFLTKNNDYAKTH